MTTDPWAPPLQIVPGLPSLVMDGNHHYRLDADPVPGVTWLLDKGLPKPALKWWQGETVAKYVAANIDEVNRKLQVEGAEELVGYLARVPNRLFRKAGVKGTQVHELAELIVHGEEVEPETEELLAYAKQYARFIDRFALEPELTEAMVANRGSWYAGKFDLLARIGSDVWLLDVKTSKGVYGDTALQVAAYASAQLAVTKDGTEIPMPHVDRIGVIHVTPDAADLYDLGSIAVAFDEFLAVKTIALSVDRRAGLTKKPLRPQDIW